MSESKHYKTAPEDKVSLYQKLAYGSGSLVNNLLGAAIPIMAMVLTIGLEMNPILVGILMALPRFTDALTDPFMGYVSDNTKSKWSRRRPYILIGAISAGILFALLWQLPPGQSESFYFWYFLVGSIIFYLGYTIFATPWVAMGYELTPDYNERTRLLGSTNAMGQLIWIALPWFWWFATNKEYFADEAEGARAFAIIVGVFVITVGSLSAILTKHRPNDPAVSDRFQLPVSDGLSATAKEFFGGLVKALKFKSFTLLAIATFLVFNGFQLGATFSNYIFIYYIYGGDKEAAGAIIGIYGTTIAVATFLIIMLVAWVATKIEKKKTFLIFVSISLFGYALKWFCYSPSNPYLILVCVPFVACGLGCLFTLMGSMVADVCDSDELVTGLRREGMFGSIFWWAVKLGMAFVLLLSGFALNATGFDIALEANQTERTLFLMRLFDVGFPFITSAIAIWVVYLYPITEEKAHQVRIELESRRGKM